MKGRAKKEQINVSTEDDMFLPNFNGITSVFTLIIFGELLAFILVLALPDGFKRLDHLSLVSLFIQWTILLSAGIITLLRPLLKKMAVSSVVAVTYIVILLVTLFNSEVALYVVYKGYSVDFHVNYVLKNLSISAIVAIITLRYIFLQHQLKRQLQAESQSRIAALQSRIRPHFLFNSMNTIAALVRGKPDVAEQTIEDLADLFRVSLSNDDNKNTLRRELEMAKKYLRIEKLRLGDRMSVKWNISEAPLDAVIPHITLQPLLENAVYHGIEPIMKGGVVQLSARLNKGELIILISNSMPSDDVKKTRKGHQIAIKNIKERLELFYSPPGKLQMIEKSGYFTVEIKVPYQSREK